MTSLARASLQTWFWDFQIAVYPDDFGHETVVLTTTGFDPTQEVLLRIHSECMTGDVFHSLRCDCGPQKDRALEMMSADQNGIFIYLRQEGRGIGIYEKIRAYALQEQGHDMLDANLILGHGADERRYDILSQIIEDFWLRQVRLLTNNPEKIKALEDIGLIVTRESIIMSTNPYNERYIDTKKQKFWHLFS